MKAIGRLQTIDEVATELGVDPSALLACLCAHGNLDSTGLRAALAMFVGTGRLAEPAQSLLLWLLHVTDAASKPRPIHGDIPRGVAVVLDYIQRLPDKDKLAAYRQLMELRRAANEAIGALDRRAADYSSLAPVVADLRRGRTQAAGLIDYYSAAWNAAGAELVDACKAVSRAGSSAMSAPMMPKALGLKMGSADLFVAQSVLWRCAETAVLRRQADKMLKDLQSSLQAAPHAPAWRILSDWGVPVVAKATSKPSRGSRRKVTLAENAKPSAQAPVSASVHSRSSNASRGKRCRSCGVYDATRGAFCDGCADGGD